MILVKGFTSFKMISGFRHSVIYLAFGEYDLDLLRMEMESERMLLHFASFVKGI